MVVVNSCGRPVHVVTRTWEFGIKSGVKAVCGCACMHVQMWYREQRLLDKKDKKESSVIFVDKGPSVAWESLVSATAFFFSFNDGWNWRAVSI